MLSALMMVIICVLAAFPIAAHLVKPIKHLTKGTQRLISGRYKTVIPITSNDELGQLSKNFNTLANTLKENEKARQQWIADISHELRTPLSILKGEIEAIQDGIRTSTPQTINSLHAEVEHLSLLINDLYELSMSDIGALNYQKSNIDVAHVLQDTLDSFRTEFENAGLTLVFNSKLKKVHHVFADATRLRQLFSNLLKNTLRYTDREGSLEIEISAKPNEVNIQFKDSAPGVREAELEKLFERLYRVESSRNRATGGAGLGLSVCQNIVSAHDGTITAKASPYGGVWISVSLPALGFSKGAHKKRELL
jgi:two-component system sensor histidine kinase BaeS